MQHIWPYGGAPVELPPELYIFRKLLSSSNWHVTLRLTFFEIFAVKWQKSVSERHPSPCLDTAFGYHQKGRRHFWDAALPSRKISRRSASPLPRYISPDKKKLSYTSDLVSDETHTSVCQITRSSAVAETARVTIRSVTAVYGRTLTVTTNMTYVIFSLLELFIRGILYPVMLCRLIR